MFDVELLKKKFNTKREAVAAFYICRFNKIKKKANLIILLFLIKTYYIPPICNIFTFG